MGNGSPDFCARANRRTLVLENHAQNVPFGPLCPVWSSGTMKPEKDQEVDHGFDKKDLDANLSPLRNRHWKAATGRCLAVPALRMALTKKINSGLQD